MEYETIGDKDYGLFHRLLEDYYREGEDAETPQNEIDDFIRTLFGMVQEHTIEGRFVKKDDTAVGFVLWAIDTESLPFSEIPGAGTILEIGVVPPFRFAGLGAQIAWYAEKQMFSGGASRCYVSAYGPAQSFWEKCGYSFCGRKAGNGLPLMMKNADENNS